MLVPAARALGGGVEGPLRSRLACAECSGARRRGQRDAGRQRREHVAREGNSGPTKRRSRSAQSSVRKLVARRDAHCQTRLRESKPKGEARDGGAIAGAMLTALTGAAALLQGPDAFADMDLPPSTMPLALGREGLPMHGGARPLPPTEAEPKGPMFDPQVAALVLSLGSGATYSGDATTPKSSGLPSPKSKQRRRTPPVPPPPLM